MATVRTCGRRFLVVVAMAGLASLFMAAPAAAQSVTTDKPRYKPGETVTIIGGGWQPGETVLLVIRDASGAHLDELLESLADGVGGFANSNFETDWTDVDLTLTVTAQGLSSGATAHTGFACDPEQGNGSLCGNFSQAGCDGATPLTALNSTQWDVPGGSTITGAISGATDASAASVVGAGGEAATSQCCTAVPLTASGTISPMQVLGDIALQPDGTWLIQHAEQNTFTGTLSGLAIVSLTIVVDPFTGNGTVTGDFAFIGSIDSRLTGTASLQVTGTVTSFEPSGTWDIILATDGLAGTTGSGTWSLGVGTFGSYTGSVTLPSSCTDAHVDVQIKSSLFGNTVVCGGLSAGTIDFSWTGQAAGGGPACETVIVAYRNCVTESSGVTTCGFLDTNNALLPGGNGQAAAGYAVGQGPVFTDPGGPYTCLAGQTIQLDGSGSHGTPPTEPVTYAWDLDNNGLFNDSIFPRPNFTCGNVSGTVYSVCLRATSTCGIEATRCTTVSVVVPSCTASDQCHIAGTFDPATGTCSNPAKPDGTPCSDGNACTTSDTCLAGTCGGGPPPNCDDGNVCTVDGCDPSSGACVNAAGNAGTMCRRSAGACDVAESCTGSSIDCPPDGFASAATSCTGTSNDGACDAADHCSGTSNTCEDVFQPDTFTCRPSIGQCDVPETCTGTSGACPGDGLASNGTSCSDGNACTQADTCQAGVCGGLNYAWTGVLQPVNGDGSSVFKLGSTVPVKFKLTSPCVPIGTLTAKIFLAKITNSILGTEVEATSTSAADTGNTFRYDASGDQYIYNLATRTFPNGNTAPLSAGTWQIRIAQYADDFELVTIGTVNISLKK